jgi:hypothetical protein
MLETPAQILEHDASADAVRSFIAWRKATKKPLTERAAIMVAKTLREITGQGGDADEALDLAQEHGWQTIKPHWYWRIKNDGQQRLDGRQNGQPPRKSEERIIAFISGARGAS